MIKAKSLNDLLQEDKSLMQLVTIDGLNQNMSDCNEPEIEEVYKNYRDFIEASTEW